MLGNEKRSEESGHEGEFFESMCESCIPGLPLIYEVTHRMKTSNHVAHDTGWLWQN
jgi:hypothetical protein